MKNLGMTEFQEFMDFLQKIPESSLFDKKGSLKEDRPKIFHFLQKVFSSLSHAIEGLHNHLERLDISLSIKTKVFGYLPQFVSYRADVEEIRVVVGQRLHAGGARAHARGRRRRGGVHLERLGVRGDPAGHLSTEPPRSNRQCLLKGTGPVGTAMARPVQNICAIACTNALAPR